MERAGRAGGAGKNKNDLLPKERAGASTFSLGCCSNVVAGLGLLILHHLHFTNKNRDLVGAIAR
jgi:hypothetical protein